MQEFLQFTRQNQKCSHTSEETFKSLELIPESIIPKKKNFPINVHDSTFEKHQQSLIGYLSLYAKPSTFQSSVIDKPVH